jgi:hypothetical protein
MLTACAGQQSRPTEGRNVSTANASYPRIVRAEGVPLARAARNGLIAGIAMAMVMMMLGIFDRGFFAAPSSILAFFAGPTAYYPRDLDPSFLLGAMGHMMNATILGIVFATLVVRIVRPSGAAAFAVTGVAFSLVVLSVMWLVVLPLGANGEIVQESASFPVWVMGHVAFGAVGGLLASRS